MKQEKEEYYINGNNMEDDNYNGRMRSSHAMSGSAGC